MQNINSETNYNLLPISVIPDKDKPLSFRVWKNRFEIIIPEQAYLQYNEYLVNWYKNKNTNKNDLSLQTKLNFLNLLKQIQVYFTEEEKESWYSGIDIDNEKEVLLAIPYFARKLKNISLYYLRLREQIKKSKLKYNLTGSNKGTVKQIRDIILQNYTKKGDGVITLPSSLWTQIPAIRSIQNSFVVEIEELYDPTSYFDRSPTLAPSAYFLIEKETEKYFLAKGIDLFNIDWVYRLGTFTLSSLNNSSLQSTVDPGISSVYFDLAQKYLGRDFYSSLIVESSAKKDFYNIDIISGNNFFYYPTGPYKINVAGLPRYKPTPLSATALQTLGTAGSSIENADTIFVKTKKGIDGAWFRKKVLDTGAKTMNATIEGNTSTIFRFPYPGFGISAEDISWTGYGLTTDSRFFYLDETTRKGIEQVYWNSSFSLSGIKPLPINSTSLINNGAYPSKKFDTADKIRIWPTPPPYENSAYNENPLEAWLYKFTETNISIGTKSNNFILWPYYKIPDPTTLTNGLPETPDNICLPEPISNLSLPFAVASNHLSSSDVIYKVVNLFDTPNTATECAWLSATSSYVYPKISTFGFKNNNFNLLLTPGVFTYFVWDGNTVDANEVFNPTETHASDCTFLNTPNVTYKDHKLCSCKLVNFVPLGHPGENFYDYNGLCDIIIEDYNLIPLSSIDLSNWRDSEGNPFATSTSAGWYKTSKDIGWGYGTWYTNNTKNGNRFYLQRGKRYAYYRANSRANDSFPPLAVRQNNNNTTPGVWMEAVRGIEGKWVPRNTRSNMTLNPNDLIIYSRAGTTTYNITGSFVTEQIVVENRGSVWSSYDYITVNHPTNFISIGYPLLYSQGIIGSVTSDINIYKQMPNIPPGSFQRVLNWKVTDPKGSSAFYYEQELVTFKPAFTGIYTIELTGVSSLNGQTGCFYFSAIPPITCVPTTVIVPTLSAFTTPVPGFILTTDLRGWNYSTNQPSNVKNENSGAKPFWAISYLNKDSVTNFKSVESWSPATVYFDTFNPVSFYAPSDIVLNGGEYLEYKRKPQTRITWSQDIELNNKVNINEWCKLEFTNVTTPTINRPFNGLITKYTTTPSTILLQNYVENEPVEIYYNALNSFILPITAEPTIPQIVYAPPISSVAVASIAPWSNLTNQFYPTVASFPAIDSLQSGKEIGLYFKPQNLGLLSYVNKDYTYKLTLSSIDITNVYSSPSQKINNRGLSKENQISPFSITKENNIWIKEPYTTGSLAGTIKKDIFKKYQKFIPYQSTYESNPLTRLGLTTPVSRQHPWGGFQDTQWADLTNQPISFTGQINVSHWTKDQVLKNTTLQLDKWCSDIFGNQYGLYKDIKDSTPSQRPITPGQLWIRKNSQQTEPSYTALLEVFDTYKSLNLYNELTGTGINNIEVFYDTLYIETSSAIIFEKINYDYSKANIFSIADSARSISLLTPAQSNLSREFSNTIPFESKYAKVGDTWFFAKDKKVVISLVEQINTDILFSLYTLSINDNILKKTFSISLSANTFDSSNVATISKPTLSYCASKKQFLSSFILKTLDSKNTIVSIFINNFLEFELDKIKFYYPQPQESLPPFILTDLNITIPTGSTFIQQIIASSEEVSFEPISFPDWASLTSDGIFTANPTTSNQNYNLPFKISNNAGPVYASLNITTT